MKKNIFIFIFMILLTASQIIYAQNSNHRKSVIVSGGIAKYNNSYLTEAAAIGYNLNIETHRYVSSKVYLLGVMSYFRSNRTGWYDINRDNYPTRKDIERSDFFTGFGLGVDFFRQNRHTLYGQVAVGADMYKMSGKIEFMTDKSPINDKTPASEIAIRTLNNNPVFTWQAQYQLGYNYQLSTHFSVGLAYLGNILGETDQTFTQNIYEKNVYISGFDLKIGYSF